MSFRADHLIYFADPMCSWCWGFATVIEAIEAEFGAQLPIHPIMGGLRPGSTEPMSAASGAEIRRHWEHVAEASGQPFDFGFFARERFVYDTEPAARAVVLVRRTEPDLTMAYLKAVQRAFYADNRDVTDLGVLADIAAGLGIGRAGFLAELDHEDARQAALADFGIAFRAGIRGFPALIAGHREGEPYEMITNGFQPKDQVLPRLRAWRAAGS